MIRLTLYSRLLEVLERETCGGGPGMQISATITSVVMQPNTQCNLDCSYCYLPARRSPLRMDERVADAVAESLARSSLDTPVDVIWHGGEPTFAGVKHLENLVARFDKYGPEKFRHGIQTNATLLNADWIDFFRTHRFLVGVSLDGPSELNSRRVNWSGKDTLPRSLRGVALLREADMPFTAIAVVGKAGLLRAAEIYNFFAQLGCLELGINLEEEEGTNAAPGLPVALVDQFWDDLWTAWMDNPVLQVRELSQVMSWMAGLTKDSELATVSRDPFPTIGWDGNTVLFSPELLGAIATKYDNFVAGNVLDTDLHTIVANGLSSAYGSDFAQGIRDCETSCEYFSYCLGGQASNKFFELGSTRGTKTNFCTTQAMRLVESGVRQLEHAQEIQEGR